MAGVGRRVTVDGPLALFLLCLLCFFAGIGAKTCLDYLLGSGR